MILFMTGAIFAANVILGATWIDWLAVPFGICVEVWLRASKTRKAQR